MEQKVSLTKQQKNIRCGWDKEEFFIFHKLQGLITWLYRVIVYKLGDWELVQAITQGCSRDILMRENQYVYDVEWDRFLGEIFHKLLHSSNWGLVSVAGFITGWRHHFWWECIGLSNCIFYPKCIEFKFFTGSISHIFFFETLQFWRYNRQTREIF